MALEFSTNPSVEEIPGTILPGGVDHRQARLETRRRGGGAAPGTKSLLGLEDIVKRKTFFETFCNMSLPNVDSTRWILSWMFGYVWFFLLPCWISLGPTVYLIHWIQRGVRVSPLAMPAQPFRRPLLGLAEPHEKPAYHRQTTLLGVQQRMIPSH